MAATICASSEILRLSSSIKIYFHTIFVFIIQRSKVKS